MQLPVDHREGVGRRSGGAVEARDPGGGDAAVGFEPMTGMRARRELHHARRFQRRFERHAAEMHLG